WMALKITLRLLEHDLEGALAALMDAARQPDLDDQMFSVPERLFERLGKHKDRPDVAACLAHAVEHGGQETRMFAALALAREDLLVPIVRSELAASREKGHDIAAN